MSCAFFIFCVGLDECQQWLLMAAPSWTSIRYMQFTAATLLTHPILSLRPLPPACLHLKCCMQLTIGISLSPTMNLILLLILFFFHDTRLHNINIILTPHSLHYCTRMSRLFLNPASSDANKEVSHAKRRPGMMSLPHFTLQLSSLSIKG